jgi:hypothetical protein
MKIEVKDGSYYVLKHGQELSRHEDARAAVDARDRALSENLAFQLSRAAHENYKEGHSQPEPARTQEREQSRDYGMER